ncbi:unnamed protein product [Amoebophrya sp. A25]|nr:unnamed protein product [Amoebophrya sp. A25]|eukprot:GSA25T00011094001.1
MSHFFSRSSLATSFIGKFSLTMNEPVVHGRRGAAVAVRGSIRRLMYSTRRRQVYRTTLGSPFRRSRTTKKKRCLVEAPWMIFCGLGQRERSRACTVQGWSWVCLFLRWLSSTAAR